MSGPFYRYTELLWENSVNRRMTRYQQWYRNPKHLIQRAPLAYVLAYTQALNRMSDSPNTYAGYCATSDPPQQWGRWRDDVHNRCYEKFVAKTQAAASQIGVSLGERKQSMQMVEKRVTQLWRAAKALRRGRPYEFFDELGIVPRRWVPRKSDPKKAADLWLEWHFGWEPAIHDIYNAIVILQSPVPQLIKVRVRASAIPDRADNSQDFAGSYTVDYTYGQLREQMGARIGVSNPNLWRATNLGLTNPFAVALELVPFSFVVGWFVPIGQFLDSWTDLLGLSIDHPYTTQTRFYKSEYQSFAKNDGSELNHYQGLGFRMERFTSISGPVINFRPLKMFGASRSATAVSLLLQQFYGMAADAKRH